MRCWFIIWLHTDGSQRVGPQLWSKPTLDLLVVDDAKRKHGIDRILGLVSCMPKATA